MTEKRRRKVEKEWNADLSCQHSYSYNCYIFCAGIPVDELYSGNKFLESTKVKECKQNNIVRWRDGSKKCFVDTMYSIDYNCRYFTRHLCYCCGPTKKYIEHGSICHRFCLKTEEKKHGVGQAGIIEPPFDWG